MATQDDERHQIIARNVLRRPDMIADDSILLWQRLALELAAIIGHGGFHSLYARSVHLARAHHPWLADATDQQFIGLKECLAQQESAQAGAASIALLTIFTDTLILLIGELLTMSLLRSAWEHDTVDNAGKEAQQ
ncbi:hypothetical protein ACFOLJ_12120 [Rugamonas sp. CCM 8940]|uniref:hypothetical protein n=1 Tax=Rugamonas sp. CCM 8940 TaxID=2765359 RepID=UPI0018F62EBC|nr:hypothetical protein [Rugamonas sp. CCM 8940]MBJ7311514.1 hypothetical protein [Rugamonas sp. CCM 8940]